MPSRSDDTTFERMAEALDLRNRANLPVRVFWIGRLRTHVEKRMPRNKSGAPVMSDVDVMLATPEETRLAFEETVEALTSGKITSTKPFERPSPVYSGGRHDRDCPLSHV